MKIQEKDFGLFTLELKEAEMILLRDALSMMFRETKSDRAQELIEEFMKTLGPKKVPLPRVVEEILPTHT